jgi:hypothetical protein
VEIEQVLSPDVRPQDNFLFTNIDNRITTGSTC